MSTGTCGNCVKMSVVTSLYMFWEKQQGNTRFNTLSVSDLKNNRQKIPPSEIYDFGGRYSCLGLFPVIQFWQLSLEIGSDLLWGPGFIGHMAFQKIQQLFGARVNEFPIGIAPLAILLVEGAVRLPADAGVLQRHTTALADQLPG